VSAPLQGVKNGPGKSRVSGCQPVRSCFLPIGVGFFFLAANALVAQQAASPLAFEVATIKPSAPVDPAALRAGTAHINTKIDAGRVDIGTMSLLRLICIAYRLKPYQVSGPEWLKSANYDIQAKIPDGVPAEKAPEMFQTLLVERFGLTAHRDSKEQPVYALVVAKGGAKMKESSPESAPPPPAAGTPKEDSVAMPTALGDVKATRTAQGISIEMPGGEISGKLRVSVSGGGGAPPRIHVESSGTTMKTLAELLSTGVVDRPVVDLTGLAGRYEVAVDLSQEDATNVLRSQVSLIQPRGGGGGGGGDAGSERDSGASDPSGSSIFTSIQNLGLRLEPRKLPLDILVIDRMEKAPSAN
jgi:uncharacterized protein (TIGR03435 family)